MNTDRSLNKIKTDDDLMEIAQHGSDIFPFQLYDEHMSDFDFQCVDWHWHTEFEFVYLESGSVHFIVGDKSFDLYAGTGIFINSRILHRMHSEEDAAVPNFLCLPSFIAPVESLIYQKYVRPIADSSLAFQIFTPDQSWQEDILSDIKKIISIWRTESADELMISFHIQKLWFSLFKNISELPAKKTKRASAHARLQIMMRFIHEYYAQNLILEDIAASANISKSTALNLFKEVLHTSPVSYLVSFRLKEAALLLSNTEKKIGAIALETGFHNVDYFCRTFKRTYGATPTEYRNRKRS